MIERLVESVEDGHPLAHRLAVALVNVAGLDYNAWSKPGHRLESAARAAREGPAGPASGWLAWVCVSVVVILLALIVAFR